MDFLAVLGDLFSSSASGVICITLFLHFVVAYYIRLHGHSSSLHIESYRTAIVATTTTVVAAAAAAAVVVVVVVYSLSISVYCSCLLACQER